MQHLLLPRGIRNNNPGNIRHGKKPWTGQNDEQADFSFVTFCDPVMGLRALMRLLLVYFTKHGLDTVESIINRYAPPHENATDSYIHQVARHLGVTRRTPLNLKDRHLLIRLAQAITLHENGPPAPGYTPEWFAHDIYAKAADLALDSP